MIVLSCNKFYFVGRDEGLNSFKHRLRRCVVDIISVMQPKISRYLRLQGWTLNYKVNRGDKSIECFAVISFPGEIIRASKLLAEGDYIELKQGGPQGPGVYELVRCEQDFRYKYDIYRRGWVYDGDLFTDI